MCAVSSPTRSTAWAHIFRRALTRAGITTGDVSLHTLRHTALSRMIASGIDTSAVMAISGHSSVRMLERYTHPTDARKVAALESFATVGQNLGRMDGHRLILLVSRATILLFC